jgi:hypothetical protein
MRKNLGNDKAGWWWLRLLGRLKPGATMEQARAQLETVFQQSVVEHRTLRQASRRRWLPPYAKRCAASRPIVRSVI